MCCNQCNSRESVVIKCNYLQINIKCGGKNNILPEMPRLPTTQTSVQGLQLVGNITHSLAPAHFFLGSPCFTFILFLTLTPGSCPTQSQFDSWLQSCPTGDIGGVKNFPVAVAEGAESGADTRAPTCSSHLNTDITSFSFDHNLKY